MSKPTDDAAKWLKDSVRAKEIIAQYDCDVTRGFGGVVTELLEAFGREVMLLERKRCAEIVEEFGGIGGFSDRLCERIAAAIEAEAAPPARKDGTNEHQRDSPAARKRSR